MAQGDHKIETEGEKLMFVLEHKEIKFIPEDRTVKYTNIVVEYRPQKSYPNCVIITVGRNLINYSGELTIRTADITTSKILSNSMFSTINAKHMSVGIKKFYLCTLLDRLEYMRIPL